jgi:outer membrane protein
MKALRIMIALTVCWLPAIATAQADYPDSITIEQAVALALQNAPSVRQAESRLTAAEALTDVRRSALYPDVSLTGDYAHIGPVPSFDLPGSGTIELAPRNNYDFHVGLHHTLYDFGKTDETIRLAETSRRSAADNIDLAKFRIGYRTISVFNSILILHQQITVLDEQLRTLNQHLDMSVKRIAAGTATDFDTLTIQVKIAVAQSDRVDATHALQNREIIFRQLTALPPDAPVNLSGSLESLRREFNTDSLITAAFQQRPELLLARDAETTAIVASKLASLNDKPHLALNLATGFENGYEPNLNTLRGNYAAGLQVKIPVFNGNETRHREAEATAKLSTAQARTTDLEQQIQSEVRQAVSGVNSSLQKIASTDTQVRQAEEAVAMARVRYDAGVITNLDLLDAEMTLSEVKLIRLHAFYNYTESLNALNRATGRKIW